MLGTPALQDHHLLDLDDSQTRLAAEEGPEDLIRRWPSVLIDEVQRVPDLLLAVKAAVDAERQRTKGRYLERDLRAVSAVDSLGEFQRAMRAFASMANGVTAPFSFTAVTRRSARPTVCSRYLGGKSCDDLR